MRQANMQLQADRRAEILDAAERCFIRSGFHQASMQEICAEAKMSPGNLYRYFPSKEAIIAGISERNRAEAAEGFAAVQAAPDFFAGLAGLAHHYLVERSAEEVGLCSEIMAECRRNPEIARIAQDAEHEIRAGILAMLRRAQVAGQIDAGLDLDAAARVLMVLGDGISWRRIADPGFDAQKVLPLVLQMIACLLGHPKRQEESR
jgi:TetR/AcrR family transcriptional regulator, repressor for uid operon